ncbi:MAG: acyltransferase [Deltaproteobacteria bacterium]|nr:acyltransferase [Deltaproteobacteria bacterium]
MRPVRSALASRKVTERKSRVPIHIRDPFLKVTISVAPTARFVCNGILTIDACRGGNEPVAITLGERSELIIDGDFIIGNGTRIILEKEASLYIGGKRHESASGITEKSLVMVRKRIYIGADCIIAWNVFITDCDWHSIHGRNMQEDVTIGEHVWIACNVSILKGSKIGNNCIVGAHSMISRKAIPDHTLVAGSPARIIANNIRWNRDMLISPEDLSELKSNQVSPENL